VGSIPSVGKASKIAYLQGLQQVREDNLLIEKVSAGIAALTKPIGTIANAFADVQAGKIKAVGEIQIKAKRLRLYADEKELLDSIYARASSAPSKPQANSQNNFKNRRLPT
jgi:hypothetical protein